MEEHQNENVFVHALKYDVDEPTHQAFFYVDEVPENTQKDSETGKKFLWQSQKWQVTIYNEESIPYSDTTPSSKRTFKRQVREANEGITFEVSEILSSHKTNNEGYKLREYIWKPKNINTGESYLLVTLNETDVPSAVLNESALTKSFTASYAASQSMMEDFDITYDYGNNKAVENLEDRPTGALAQLTYISEKLLHVSDAQPDMYELNPINMRLQFEQPKLWVDPYDGNYGMEMSHFQVSERHGDSMESSLLQIGKKIGGGYLSDFSMSLSNFSRAKRFQKHEKFDKHKYTDIPSDTVVIDQLKKPNEKRNDEDDEEFIDISVEFEDQKPVPGIILIQGNTEKTSTPNKSNLKDLMDENIYENVMKHNENMSDVPNQTRKRKSKVKLVTAKMQEHSSDEDKPSTIAVKSTTPAIKPQENMSDEDVKESSDENVKESSDENVKESSDENVKESSDENVKESSDENVKESSNENVRNFSDEDVKDSSDEDVKDSSDEDVKDSSDEDVKDSSDEDVKDSSDEDVKDSSDEDVPHTLNISPILPQESNMRKMPSYQTQSSGEVNDSGYDDFENSPQNQNKDTNSYTFEDDKIKDEMEDIKSLIVKPVSTLIYNNLDEENVLSQPLNKTAETKKYKREHATNQQKQLPVLSATMEPMTLDLNAKDKTVTVNKRTIDRTNVIEEDAITPYSKQQNIDSKEINFDILDAERDQNELPEELNDFRIFQCSSGAPSSLKKIDLNPEEVLVRVNRSIKKKSVCDIGTSLAEDIRPLQIDTIEQFSITLHDKEDPLITQRKSRNPEDIIFEESISPDLKRDTMLSPTLDDDFFDQMKPNIPRIDQQSNSISSNHDVKPSDLHENVTDNIPSKPEKPKSILSELSFEKATPIDEPLPVAAVNVIFDKEQSMNLAPKEIEVRVPKETSHEVEQTNDDDAPISTVNVTYNSQTNEIVPKKVEVCLRKTRPGEEEIVPVSITDDHEQPVFTVFDKMNENNPDYIYSNYIHSEHKRSKSSTDAVITQTSVTPLTQKERKLSSRSSESTSSDLFVRESSPIGYQQSPDALFDPETGKIIFTANINVNSDKTPPKSHVYVPLKKEHKNSRNKRVESENILDDNFDEEPTIDIENNTPSKSEKKKSLASKTKKYILKKIKHSDKSKQTDLKSTGADDNINKEDTKKSRKSSFKKVAASIKLRRKPKEKESHHDNSYSKGGFVGFERIKFDDDEDNTPNVSVSERMKMFDSDNELDSVATRNPFHSNKPFQSSLRRSRSFDSYLSDEVKARLEKVGKERENKERRRRLAGYSYVTSSDIPKFTEVVKGREYSEDACAKEREKEIRFIRSERKRRLGERSNSTDFLDITAHHVEYTTKQKELEAVQTERRQRLAKHSKSMDVSFDVVEKVKDIKRIEIPEAFLGVDSQNRSKNSASKVGKLTIPSAFSVPDLLDV